MEEGKESNASISPGPFGVTGVDRREPLAFPCNVLSTAITCLSVGEHEEFGCNLCVAQTHNRCLQVAVVIE